MRELELADVEITIQVVDVLEKPVYEARMPGKLTLVEADKSDPVKESWGRVDLTATEEFSETFEIPADGWYRICQLVDGVTYRVDGLVRHEAGEKIYIHDSPRRRK